MARWRRSRRTSGFDSWRRASATRSTPHTLLSPAAGSELSVLQPVPAAVHAAPAAVLVARAVEEGPAALVVRACLQARESSVLLCRADDQQQAEQAVGQPSTSRGLESERPVICDGQPGGLLRG